MPAAGDTILRRGENDRRLDAHDTDACLDLPVSETLQVLEAAGPDLEQKREVAGLAMTLLNLTLTQHALDERLLDLRAVHKNPHERAQRIAEPLRINQRDVCANIAARPEFRQTRFDGGNRQAYALAEFG